jgi:tetratricopeptide (TPR) repeat protein
MEPSFNRRADELIVGGRYADARALLDAAIREMPTGWTPRRGEGRPPAIAFWDMAEFLAYSCRETGTERSAGPITWVEGSYSRAWYQLAVVASEEKRFEDALFCIDCGMKLEPDHPELWNEKGYLLGCLKRHQEAFECYLRAASIRHWAPPPQIARALRGQGVQLVDLDRLDEAETALRRSLELEPDSQTARNELGYIENLRRKREAEKEKIPWFLQSFVNPPADPLTIRLLALVEDLPPIPGAKTVGQENYSRIFDAFMGRGWAGFEEEFDRVVPRQRADYADVKRDMLRETVFRPKTHRNMADAALGRQTVDRILDEIAGRREQESR